MLFSLNVAWLGLLFGTHLSLPSRQGTRVRLFFFSKNHLNGVNWERKEGAWVHGSRRCKKLAIKRGQTWPPCLLSFCSFPFLFSAAFQNTGRNYTAMFIEAGLEGSFPETASWSLPWFSCEVRTSTFALIRVDCLLVQARIRVMHVKEADRLDLGLQQATTKLAWRGCHWELPLGLRAAEM